jgi:hypothetical protein
MICDSCGKPLGKLRLQGKSGVFCGRKCLNEYLLPTRPATGETLNKWGELLGVKRKRFWFFKESDQKYRKRILDVVDGVNENIDREAAEIRKELAKCHNEQ